jgi:hypothetical protein
MAIRLNHTIVAAHEKEASATFLTQLLGLPAPLLLGPFAVVQVGDTSLDYMNVEEYRGPNSEITPQHYAFLVSESEFAGSASHIGPTLAARSTTRSTPGTMGAGSTLTT